jgi:hypothetical protein
MFRASALAAAGVLAVSGAVWAKPSHPHHAPKAVLTITLDGTLGPVISGSDPAGLDGDSATVTVVASESLKPYKTTASSASYHIPVGAITVNVNGTDYSSTAKSSMVVQLGKTADTLTLKASLDYNGVKVQVTDVSSLAVGSWTKSVLQHPAVFAPSPQDLSEPSSNLTYTAFGSATKLGVTGTASNSDTARHFN